MTSSSTNHSGDAETELVLYVGQDRDDPNKFCKGSRQALVAIDEAGGLESLVTVQSINALRETMVQLPTWLKGTPTLVLRRERRALRGRAAVDYLRELQASRTQSTTSQGKKNDGDAVALTPSFQRLHLAPESNFESGTAHEDTDKYTRNDHITEQDIEKLIERRRSVVA